MAGKGRDTRPTRTKQKARSVQNKMKQIEKHLAKYPNDRYAEEKLERARKGNSRAAVGCGPKSARTEAGRRDKKKRR